MRHEPSVESFGFILHPLDVKQDVARKYPLLGTVLPTALIHVLARHWPPVLLARVSRVRSEATGGEIGGWLLGCPLSAEQMLRLPPQTVYDKIVQAGRLAQRQGVRILGLGAYTSVVGDGGVTVAQRLNMPVTTGNSLTVALAVEALTRRSEDEGLAVEKATAAVVGASGSIGLASAEMLAPLVESVVLIGRREIRLSQARAEVEAAGAADVRISTQIQDVLEADLVFSATSAPRPVIEPHHLKKGAVVCDVARPPDVSATVRQEREDVTVIQGGIVEVPGRLDLGFDLGLPPGHVYACLAEAMILALEGRYESFSLGQKVHREKAREIARLARKHGFELSGETKA